MTTMTEQATITVGRGDVYPQGCPTGTPVDIGGRAFVELPNGKLLEQCGRCSPAWSGSVEHFGHVYAGVCFECAGYGYRKAFNSRADVEKVLARRAKARARAAAKREAAYLAEQAARDEWAAANPVVSADLALVVKVWDADPDGYTGGGFVLDVAQKSLWKPLTQAQVDAVAPAAAAFVTGYIEGKAADAAKAATQRYADVEVGQKGVTVTGTVAVAMTIETQWGASRLVIVEGSGDDEGVTAKMFGTGETMWEATRGDEVTVTGTVKDLEVYEGTPQTRLTRAKITTITKAEEA